MKAPRLILSAFVAFGLASCGTPQGGGAPGPRPASAQQAERQQSQQLLAELQQKNMLVKGDRVNDYVDEITARINAVRPNNASRLRTYIIKDASANAFTSGAGYVFIHAGLLATMENEAQLAMVLAHEIAHEDLGHVSAGMAQRQNVAIGQMLAGIGGALLGVPGELTNLVAGVGGQAYYADFSRDQERAADDLGMKYLVKAGYDGVAGAKSFQVMRRMYGDSSSFLSTHPGTTDRQRALEAEARQLGGAQGRVAADEYLKKTNQVRKQAIKVYQQNNRSAELQQARSNLRGGR
ncbi:MAG: M48 family metalloprotease [Albimonas sp.]|mgnify:CR=1 FL=1|uniref:M48 family metalloprotease n=1 Tax=Albimonas sp. TaxID=1872425 RepID=UPI00405610F0|tara:strand:- start:372 stop:1253 length:882 start_codon:yes stop_codon:yes gene_type:complete